VRERDEESSAVFREFRRNQMLRHFSTRQSITRITTGVFHFGSLEYSIILELTLG